MYQIKYVVVDSCFGAEHKVEIGRAGMDVFGT